MTNEDVGRKLRTPVH